MSGKAGLRRGSRGSIKSKTGHGFSRISTDKKKRRPRPSLSAVQRAEGAGKHERHDQDAGSKHEHVRSLAQIEGADTTDQQVADDKVKQAPQDVDDRRGQAYARRVCEGALKGMA